MLERAIMVVNELHPYWPVSVRQVHYGMPKFIRRCETPLKVGNVVATPTIALATKIFAICLLAQGYVDRPVLAQLRTRPGSFRN